MVLAQGPRLSVGEQVLTLRTWGPESPFISSQFKGIHTQVIYLSTPEQLLNQSASASMSSLKIKEFCTAMNWGWEFNVI